MMHAHRRPLVRFQAVTPNLRGLRVRTLRLGIIASFIVSIALAGPALAAPTARPASGSVQAAQPSDTELFAENFSSGNLSNWTVTTNGQGTATVVSQAGPTGAASQMARLTVPNYTTNSIAYIRKPLSSPVYALSAVGYFKVLTGGCDNSAGYSAGNVPFFRFFDTTGRRVVGPKRSPSGQPTGITATGLASSGRSNSRRITSSMRMLNVVRTVPRPWARAASIMFCTAP